MSEDNKGNYRSNSGSNRPSSGSRPSNGSRPGSNNRSNDSRPRTFNRDGPRSEGPRNGGFNNRGGNSGGPRKFSDKPRESFKTVCAECKAECDVPFKPTEGRPVYCRECFKKHKPQF